jgi:hypothetical protein
MKFEKTQVLRLVLGDRSLGDDGCEPIPLLKASLDHLFLNARKPLKDNVKKTKEKGAKWNS